MTATDSVRDELPDPHTTAGKIAELERRRHEAVHAGSAAAVEKQHAKGKLTARERIGLLLDEGSFTEFDELARHRAHDFGIEKNRPYGDGVVTGTGTVDGRPVAVYSQDFTVFGGSLGEVYGEKIVKIMDHAMKAGCPVIGINDGGGARIQEGVVALGLFAEIFFRNTRASGVIPQISLIMGPAAGGAVYSPAITDFVLMVQGTSHMFITGPDVIKTVTGEDVTFEELGGAHAHAARSGVAHYQAADEADCIEFAKLLLSYLPSNNLDEPPVVPVTPDYEVSETDAELDTLIPDSSNQPYDIHRVIETVLDADTFCEVHEAFAPNIVTGFGRVAGAPVGVVANQPMHFAGCLDIDASEKAARFVRTCDAFSIPILTFVDVPGFLPGVTQEWAGIIRRGAKLLYAYAEATVPKVTVITRKAYGGAYDVMGSKHLGGDVNLAWPTAQIAVMGAAGAVNILYRRELASAGDPEERRRQLTTEYEDTLANPYIAAERGYVDAVIRPAETRVAVTRALISLRTKRETLPPKKHGNIPLLSSGQCRSALVDLVAGKVYRDSVGYVSVLRWFIPPELGIPLREGQATERQPTPGSSVAAITGVLVASGSSVVDGINSLSGIVFRGDAPGMTRRTPRCPLAATPVLERLPRNPPEDKSCAASPTSRMSPAEPRTSRGIRSRTQYRAKWPAHGPTCPRVVGR